MIKATSEPQFVWFALRGWVGFGLKKRLNWIRNGHLRRRAVVTRYLAGHEERKLHLGASFEIPGYLNSQILGEAPIDITGPLPLPDRSFDLIYSSHLIEHVHRAQFAAFLREARRVLKPGGINIIATPGLESMCRHVYGESGEGAELLLARSGEYYGEGDQTGAHFFNLEFREFGHRFIYDTPIMRQMAQAAGYSACREVGNFDLPDPAIRDYLQSRKPPRWDVLTQTYLLTR